MSNTSNYITESLFDSVNLLIDKKLEDVSYDSTIVCTVVDDSKAKNGEYKVTDGNINYTAYSDSDKYLSGEQVRVQVPMGDFSQKKFIIGKYVSDNDSTPITYVSPADTVLNVSGNLVGNLTGGIVANGTDTKRILWNNRDMDQSFLAMQDNDIYNTIILKANFRTLFSQSDDIVIGNYGLRLDFLVQPSTSSTNANIRRTVELDSSEMFGNPYSFSIESPQAKIFKINTIGIIKGIELSIYQKGNFVTRNNGPLVPLTNGPDNIIVSDIVLGFGSDLITMEDNKLQIYCQEDHSYKYGKHNNKTNLKQMGLLWYNKDDNNAYVGFSDGIYDATYDEFEYLKEASLDTRLTSQKGRENIPEDKTSLKLAANLQEAVPSIKEAVDVVNQDLISLLRDLQIKVQDNTTYVNNINKLIGDGDKRLATYTENIISYLGEGKEVGMIPQYNAVLKYGYEIWKKKEHSVAWIDDTTKTRLWPITNANLTLAERNNYNRLIFYAFYDIKEAVEWLFSKTGGFTKIDGDYAGYKSIYDTYKLRATRLMATMWGYLGMAEYYYGEDYKTYDKYFPYEVLFIDEKLNETKSSDFVRLVNYIDKEVKDFKLYRSPDLSKYDNKYCIYWYREEKDYVAPDTESIVPNGWRRIVNEDFYEKITLNSDTYEKNKYYTYDEENKKFVKETGNFNSTKVYYKFPSKVCATKGDKDRINIGLSSLYYYTDDMTDNKYKFRTDIEFNENRRYYEKKNEKWVQVSITKDTYNKDIHKVRVCVNDDDKFLHAPKVANGHGILKRYMQNDTTHERYMAVLFYNHNMYKSNVLEFVNADVVPDKTTLDQGDILIFEHGENSADGFQSYAITNYLMDAADESRLRRIRCHYDGLLAKDNAFVGGSIYWYVPNNSTMLTVDVEDLTSDVKGFTLDETRSTYNYKKISTAAQKEKYPYEANKFYIKEDSVYRLSTSSTAPSAYFRRDGYNTYCFYKVIEAKKKSDVVEATYEWDKWDYTNGTTIDNRDFWYKIKPYYQDSAVNNEITCIFAPPESDDEITGTQLFTFGIKGTSGTKYTLAVTHSTATQVATTTSKGVPLKAELKDFDNNVLSLSEDGDGLEVKWQVCGLSGDNITEDSTTISTSGSGTVLIDPPKGYFGLMDLSTSIMLKGTEFEGSDPNKTSVGKTRQVDLNVVYAVPYTSGNYYIQGPTQIIYNSLGTLDNNSMFNTPYKIFKAISDEEVTGVTWSIKYYKADKKKYVELKEGNTQKSRDEYNFYHSYMPVLQNNNLVPSPIYLDGLDCYAVVTARKNNDILWRQPIIILQNRYASSMLNDWDGSLTIDEKNGTILASMIGAGRKASNNTFEGVLMGDVGLNAGQGFENGDNIGLTNHTGLGLYGFHQGAQSFGFNIDGTAFLGKAGGGRIIFRGDQGVIASQNWFTGGYVTDADINKYGGKVTKDGITKNSVAGMCIDLLHGHIDAYDFKLTSDNIYFNSHPMAENAFQDNVGHYLKVGSDATLGQISLSASGELVIKSNNLYLTGQLGNTNLLQQTSPYQKIVEAIDKKTVGSQSPFSDPETGYVIYPNKDGSYTLAWVIDKWKVASKNKLDVEVEKVSLDGGAEEERRYIRLESPSTATYHYIQQPVLKKCRANKEYTLSGYVRCDVATTLTLTARMTNPDDTDSTQIVGTMTEGNYTYSNNKYSLTNEYQLNKDEWHYVRYTFKIDKNLHDRSGLLDKVYIRFNLAKQDSTQTLDLWHMKLEEGTIATAWSPSPQDVENANKNDLTSFDIKLSQDALFKKLFIDPETGLKMDGVHTAFNPVTQRTELYINATYIATGILRSANWKGWLISTNGTKYEYNELEKVPKDKAFYRTEAQEGMYVDLNSGKIWSAEFELNAFRNNKGLYLNSKPYTINNTNNTTNTGLNQGIGTLDNLNYDNYYYLKLGNFSKSYISFDGDGAFKMRVNEFELTSAFGGTNLLNDTAPRGAAGAFVRNAWLSSPLTGAHWKYNSGSSGVANNKQTGTKTIAKVANSTVKGKSIKLYNGSSLSDNYRHLYQELGALRSSDKYILSGWVYVPTSKNSITFKIRASGDSENENYSKQVTWSFTPEATGWQYISHIFDIGTEELKNIDFKEPRFQIVDYNLTEFNNDADKTVKAENATWFHHLKLEQGTVATQWGESEQDKLDTLNIYDNEQLLQDAVFNKLTNNGAAKGIFLNGGKLYINATYIASSIIRSSNWAATYTINGKSYNQNQLETAIEENPGHSISDIVATAGMYINLDDGMIWSKKLKVSAGDKNSDNFLGLYTSYSTQEYWTDEGTSIAGSGNLTTWRIIAGKNFGVTRSGALYASSAHVTGTITANSGTIGKWTITTGGNLQSVNNSVVLNGTSGNITGARVYANVLKAGGNGNSDGTYILTADGSSVNITGATIKGNNNGGTYAYQLTSAGKLTATSAILTTLTVKGTLVVQDQASAHIKGPVGINVAPSSSYDLYVNGKSYLSGNIGIGTAPVDDYGLKIKGDIYMVEGDLKGNNGSYISFGNVAQDGGTYGVWYYGGHVFEGTVLSKQDFKYRGDIYCYTNGAYAKGVDGQVAVDGKGIFTGGIYLTFKNGILVSTSKPDDNNTIVAAAIPTYEAADAGKFLRVRTGGQSLGWEAAYPPTTKGTDGYVWTSGGSDGNPSWKSRGAFLGATADNKGKVLKSNGANSVIWGTIDSSVSWGDIENKPTTFKPQGHDHSGTSHSHKFSITINGVKYEGTTESTSMVLSGAIT